MTKVGNMVVGQGAELLRLDAGFCEIMRAPAEAMIGRTLSELTAPPDRAACRAAMMRLWETGEPFQVDKRMLRPDGSVFRVIKTVSIVDYGDGDRQVAGVIVPVEPVDAPHDPAALSAEARAQHDAVSERAMIFGPTLFANPGWSMLLSAYVGETGDVPAPATVAARWTTALVAEGLMEQSGTSDRRLTPGGRSLVERYLARSLRPAAH